MDAPRRDARADSQESHAAMTSPDRPARAASTDAEDVSMHCATGHALTRRQAVQLLGLGGLGAALVGQGALASRGRSGVSAQEIQTPPPATPTALPASGITVADKAAELNYDAERIFRFVADEIRYDAYAGALRGAEGTLWSMAGNSVDQAQLLAALLKEALVPVRFASGSLDDAAVAKVFGALTTNLDKLAASQLSKIELSLRSDANQAAIGAEPDQAAKDKFLEEVEQQAGTLRERAGEFMDETLDAVSNALNEAGVQLPQMDRDKAADFVPELERQRHIWVQAADGPVWIDHDPVVPGSASGASLAKAIETFDALPEDLEHKVTIKYIAEQILGGLPQRRDVFVTGSTSAGLMNLPIAAAIVPPESFDGLGLTLLDQFQGTTSYVPAVVTSTGGGFADQPISFDTGEGGGVFGALGAEADADTLADGDTTAVWLSVEITEPGGTSVVAERAVMDRLLPEDRAAVTAGTLQTLEKAKVAAVEMTTDDNGRPIPVALRISSILTVDSGRLPSFYTLLSPRDQKDMGGLSAFGASYGTMRDALGPDLEAPGGFRSYPAAPNVTMFTFDPGDPADAAATASISADLLIHRVGLAPLGPSADQATPAAGMSGAHPLVRAGVLDHVAERLVLDPALTVPPSALGVTPDQTPPFEIGPSVGRIFGEARRQNIAIRALKPDAPDALRDVKLTTRAVPRVQAALTEGYVVVVPVSPVDLDGNSVSGWWLIDPDTGQTVDQLDDGRGGGSLVINPARAAFTETGEYSFLTRVIAFLRQNKLVFSCLGNIIGAIAGAAAVYFVVNSTSGTAAASGVAAGAAVGGIYRAIGACV